jgi:phage replication initiation protein
MKAQVGVDWLTFRYCDEDEVLRKLDGAKDRREEQARLVIRNVLGLDDDLFSMRPRGLRNYSNVLQCDDILVMYNSEQRLAASGSKYGGVVHADDNLKSMGVCVDFSGDGCRQYERMGGDVLALAKYARSNERMNVTRIDIAADDKSGMVNMSDVVSCIDECRLRTRVREIDDENRRTNWRYRKDDEKSYYIGSKSSEQFMRVYDKAKESYDKREDAAGYYGHWVRFEMVFRRHKAEEVIDMIVNDEKNGESIDVTMARVMRGHVDFLEKVETNICRSALAGWWSDFCGVLEKYKTHGIVKVKTAMQDKIAWFNWQVAPLVSTIKDAVGYDKFLSMLLRAEYRRSDEQKTQLDLYVRKYKPKGFNIGSLLPRDDFVCGLSLTPKRDNIVMVGGFA